jgi:MFS transporter, OFA family, oxalate/formate antiporter
MIALARNWQLFGTCMGTALKWFPERRGFASGVIAAGYGLGAAITVIPTL